MSDFLDGEVFAEDPIRVLICDDHALFRRGLMMVLEAEPDIEVMAETADGNEAVALAEELAPDVVLMDVRMPALGGIQATRAINEVVPTAKIVILAISDAEEDLFDAIKAGARGYLLKEVSIEEVTDAVRAVVTGQSLVSPRMAAMLLDEFARVSGSEQAGGLPSTRLTDREVEVLRSVAEGRTNREVGQQLGISENTVKNHVRNILEKLHVRSRIEAALFASREHLI